MIDEEIRMVVLALVIVAGIAAISQTMIGGYGFETFSGMGIMGPNMKLGEYPETVIVNTSYRLYLYLDNQEGRVVFYQIHMKLGDNSTFINETMPSNAAVISTYEAILPSGKNTVLPVDLRIEEPVTNAKLIFEMWIVDTNGTYYNGKWNQLWLNATLPK